jgi:hypothetical protein
LVIEFAGYHRPTGEDEEEASFERKGIKVSCARWPPINDLLPSQPTSERRAISSAGVRVGSDVGRPAYDILRRAIRRPRAGDAFATSRAWRLRTG